MQKTGWLCSVSDGLVVFREFEFTGTLTLSAVTCSQKSLTCGQKFRTRDGLPPSNVLRVVQSQRFVQLFASSRLPSCSPARF